MNVLGPEENFLGISEQQFYTYDHSKVVIQQVPYEHTSSYKKGSANGPKAMVQNSHYVEFYDCVLGQETYRHCGIACLPPMKLGQAVDEEAVHQIAQESKTHLTHNKFLVTFGGEHTVTAGTFQAFQEIYPDIGILQLDAHSDLRLTYEDNAYSHACVMARIHDMGAPSITQVGIRAQCIEEAELIKTSSNIKTWYAHELQEGDAWMDEVVKSLPSQLYISIDADGFDPSICPSVGTAEPGGLGWYQSLKLLKKVFDTCDVKGFDIVEINPETDDDITAYNMAQLCYRLLGYRFGPHEN